MDAVRLIFCPSGGQILAKGKSFIIPENHFVVTRSELKITGPHCHCFDFYAADFQYMYSELTHLLDADVERYFQPDPVRALKVDKSMMQAALSLALVNRAALLRFTYVYCLLQDRNYFSNFMRQLISGAPHFYSFIQKNILKPWSVSEFARQFDMPVRKFNLMFQEKFGTSAKSWLLTQRLNHAKALLESTSKKVLDVALECGFSNHAHFTNSFRRRFNVTPIACRHLGCCEKYFSKKGPQWMSLR